MLEHKLTEKDVAKAKRLYHGPLRPSIAKVAEELGKCSAETLRKEFRDRNIERRPTGPYRKPISKKTLIRDYRWLRSSKKVAKRYDTTEATILKLLRKYGEPILNRGAGQGDKHPRWKGGKHINDSGHILLKSPDHPNKDHLGYVREHRLVVEKHLQRFLLPTEIVHHINHNKQDNRLGNVMVFTCHYEHQIYGHPENLYGLDRSKAFRMLAAIRKARARRREALSREERRRTRLFRKKYGTTLVRIRQIVGRHTTYVQTTGSRLTFGKQTLVHRAVMQEHLKRPLRVTERVHHEDLDRSNNSISNLVLFHTQSDHKKYHRWRGQEIFRGESAAEQYLAESCVGMHNPLSLKRSRTGTSLR